MRRRWIGRLVLSEDGVCVCVMWWMLRWPTTRRALIPTEWPLPLLLCETKVTSCKFVFEIVCCVNFNAFNSNAVHFLLAYFENTHFVTMVYTVVPRFAEQVDQCIEGISARPQRDVDENEFLECSNQVYDGVHEIRLAVLMNRVGLLALLNGLLVFYSPYFLVAAICCCLSFLLKLF